MMVDIILISQRGEVWPHKSNLTPSLFVIEVPVPDQVSERPYICVLWVSILLLSTIFIFDFLIFLSFSSGYEHSEKNRGKIIKYKY